jgi:hypothetical protein
MPNHNQHRRHRPPRVEIGSSIWGDLWGDLWPTTDAELKRMSYEAALRWAAGDDGRMRSDRLERLAHVRRYKPSWVRLWAGQHWRRAAAEAVRYRAQFENAD